MAFQVKVQNRAEKGDVGIPRHAITNRGADCYHEHNLWRSTTQSLCKCNLVRLECKMLPLVHKPSPLHCLGYQAYR